MDKLYKKRSLCVCIIFTIGVAFIPITACAQSKSEEPVADSEYFPAEKWRSSTPEEQGLSSKILGKIDEYVKKDFSATTSVLVVRNGYTVFEKYYQGNETDLRSQFSITKSVISAVTGIAISKGIIAGIDKEAYSYLPDTIRLGMSDNARKIKIYNLLTMTSGLDHNGGAGDIEATALKIWFSANLKNSPGKEFAYNGNNPNLLSAIITHASGIRVSEFARKYLFGPIGIKQADWSEGSEYTVGYSYLKLTTRDMARFGYLYLRKGMWNKEQVIPQEWIALSTREHTPIQDMYKTPGINDAYGFLWWTMWYDKHAAYSAIGYNGQRICVIPDYDLLIIFTGNGGGFDVEHLPIIRDCILASLNK